MNIETGSEDNIDTIREYLPNDLVIGSVNPLQVSEYEKDSNKIYEVVLVVS